MFVPYLVSFGLTNGATTLPQFGQWTWKPSAYVWSPDRVAFFFGTW